MTAYLVALYIEYEGYRIGGTVDIYTRIFFNKEDAEKYAKKVNIEEGLCPDGVTQVDGYYVEEIQIGES